LGFNGDLYQESGATSVLSTKGDIVRYNTERERYGIGSANQILQVKSNLPSWETVDLADTVLTTAGDVLYENATPELARLPISSNGDVLTLAGGLPTWATPSASGGKYEQLYQNSASGGGTPQVITATFSPALALANYSNVLCVLTAYDTLTGTNDIIINVNGYTGSQYYLDGIQITGGSATYKNANAQTSWIVKGGATFDPFWQLIMNIALPHNTYTAMTWQYGGQSMSTAGGGYLESVASNDIDTIAIEFQGSASVRDTELTIYGLAQ